jgi:hypothetical protein
MLPLWGHGTFQEGVPRVGVANKGDTFTFNSSLRTTRIQRVVLDFPIVFFPFRLFAGELIPPTLTFTFDPSLQTSRIRRVGREKQNG